MKTCRKCLRELSLESFDTNRKVCRGCRRKEQRLRRQKRHKENPQKYQDRLKQQREAAWLRKFNLTPEAYKQMFTDRKGLCDICHKPETRRINGKLMPLCVDHDAETGLVRGLLCSNHNIAIGLFNHNCELLRSSIEYLQGR